MMRIMARRTKATTVLAYRSNPHGNIPSVEFDRLSLLAKFGRSMGYARESAQGQVRANGTPLLSVGTWGSSRLKAGKADAGLG